LAAGPAGWGPKSKNNPKKRRRDERRERGQSLGEQPKMESGKGLPQKKRFLKSFIRGGEKAPGKDGNTVEKRGRAKGQKEETRCLPVRLGVRGETRVFKESEDFQKKFLWVVTT